MDCRTLRAQCQSNRPLLCQKGCRHIIKCGGRLPQDSEATTLQEVTNPGRSQCTKGMVTPQAPHVPLGIKSNTGNPRICGGRLPRDTDLQTQVATTEVNHTSGQQALLAMEATDGQTLEDTTAAAEVAEAAHREVALQADPRDHYGRHHLRHPST